MVFGTFDPLHEGHRDMFRQARLHGDYLVVVIARDVTVEKIKGIPPHHLEEDRLRVVADEELVDKAVLGSTTDKMAVIREIVPDVICLGYDQQHVIVDELFAQGFEIEIVRLVAHQPEKFKSSIIKKLLK